MLVLNRRPGETIIIEPDIRVTVLSIGDGRVWLGLHAPGTVPDLRLSATVMSPTEARLEIGPLLALEIDGAGVHMTSAPASHPAAAMQAGLSLTRREGERLEIDGGLWVLVGTLPKGNPSITFGGPSIGEELTIAVIRPAGNYVRIGVDAPNRRIYREELWETVRAAALAGAGDEAESGAGAGGAGEDGDGLPVEPGAGTIDTSPELDSAALDPLTLDPGVLAPAATVAASAEPVAATPAEPVAG